ncbi:hypothetical protein AGABI2DRAFT_123130 [Agaricus bisporus var. bisporus H97]|uniref:hypothetical protein n=1 Tax=Agaricus bisporus var. bisporus (strain H97 / ATCC MYA-4626 / FGSC 10389) TaxID=936046 RepID=UPI00029F60DD|nr:hypothetical protein AGABI2DRAFT_123130 [Agaricus bisporus var. bisporus H97]EKV42011.1 hypothetical protein AGABI2DRAFT_123130 [Agaricus bisporus var. bisporus H97]
MSLFIFCLCLCLAIHILYRYRQKRFFPRPPGPFGWPLIGNALQLPLERMHIFYEELGRKFGSGILYVEALGQPIIVINDVQIAIDLLEKRSLIYSSRPRSVMLHDLIKADKFFGIMAYGDEWKNSRRIFQQYFSFKNMLRVEDKILTFVRTFFLPNILEDPEDFDEHIRSCIGGASLSLIYGLPVQRINDPFIHSIAEPSKRSGEAASAGKYLVNIIPILKYIPEWMPGTTFKRVAREIRVDLNRITNVPFENVLKNMRDGTAPESFVSVSLEDHRHRPNFEMQETSIKYAAAQIFGGAYDTTVASMKTFILVMLLYPDIQQKVHEEIDSVIGFDQLPDFSDKVRLPYLSAVLKELLRWNPITPLVIPHCTTADDVYEGYYIPKGSIVLANAHAMLHNPDNYPNPVEFRPERFMKEGVEILDPFTAGVFGFGRRICPGSHVAQSILYIIAASFLSLFDVKPVLDDDGRPVEVKPEFTTASLQSVPLPFKCQITPREGKNVENLLQDYMGVDVL